MGAGAGAGAGATRRGRGRAAAARGVGAEHTYWALESIEEEEALAVGVELRGHSIKAALVDATTGAFRRPGASTILKQANLEDVGKGLKKYGRRRPLTSPPLPLPPLTSPPLPSPPPLSPVPPLPSPPLATRRPPSRGCTVLPPPDLASGQSSFSADPSPSLNHCTAAWLVKLTRKICSRSKPQRHVR